MYWNIAIAHPVLSTEINSLVWENLYQHTDTQSGSYTYPRLQSPFPQITTQHNSKTVFASKYFLVSANEWRNPSIRLLRQDHVIIKLGPCLVNQSQWLCWGRALWRTTADKICSIVICRGVKINGLLIICWNSIKFVTGFFMMYIAHRADGWQSFIFTLLLCNISSKKTIENFKNTQWYTNNLALKICLLWFIRSIFRSWI